MSTSKIVVDADHGKLDAASKKSAAEMRKIADAAKGVGTHLDKWGNQLISKVGGLTAILNTIRAVGAEVERQRSAATDASKSVGGGALGRSQAIRALGLDQSGAGAAGIDAVIRQGAGGTGVNERDAFFQAMAGRKGKDSISGDNAMRALTLFNSGLYSQDELLTAASGDGSGLDGLRKVQAQRFADLSPAAREDLALRQQERVDSVAAEDARAESGRSARVLASRKNRVDAENPFWSGVSNIASEATGGVGGQIADVLRELNGAQTRTLNEIEKNTRPALRPTFATQPAGEK